MDANLDGHCPFFKEIILEKDVHHDEKPFHVLFSPG